jgi:site-specific recombinase
VALRSRGLRFKELIPIGAAIWVAFLKNKKVFFFPPAKVVLPLEAESKLFKNPENK